MVSYSNLEQKISKFKQILSKKKVITAFSGGMDSTLLLLLARKFSAKFIPVFFFGPMFTKEELHRASNLCKILKIQLEIIDFNPLTQKEFQQNPQNRCYYCKKYIMTALLQIQDELDYDIIIEGTNTTDLGEFRPGYDVLQEMGIVSPFVLSEFSKKDIHDYLEYSIQNPEWILDSPNSINSVEITEILKNIVKSSSGPCLCSRIDYGVEITEDRLVRIHQAEKFLEATFNLEQVRVRLHSHDLIRIEVPKYQLLNILRSEVINQITLKLKELGFSFITVDLEGFRSGSFNQ
ncbi:MAG: 7-cyano-7-deazaguanine synthase [Candidatus Lokiarchaeota archaeon]|nr:7-cyano-7-deazaguanine synthase [Candidatus Lokiarchaeota archaeon]